MTSRSELDLLIAHNKAADAFEAAEQVLFAATGEDVEEAGARVAELADIRNELNDRIWTYQPKTLRDAIQLRVAAIDVDLNAAWNEVF